MHHASFDGNGSPVEQDGDVTLYQTPDYVAECDRITAEFVDFIASMATPDERSICRRAALNMYRLGRAHQMLDDLRTAKGAL